MARAGREKYRPSGRFDLLRTVLLLPAGVVLALALAALLMLAGESGYYFIVITPAILALPLAGLAYVGAQWARFRSPILGFVLGALLGIVFYVGRYYALMGYLGGPALMARVDVLPRFVAFCVNNQVILDDKRGGNNPSPVMNWLMFAIELGICGGMPAAAWYTGSRRPYCEQCGKWMSSKVTVLPSGSAAAVAEALDDGQLASIPIQEEITSGLPPVYSRVEVVGCTHGGEDQAATFYLTAAEVVSQGEKTKASVLLDKVALTPDEFLTLADKCQGLMT